MPFIHHIYSLVPYIIVNLGWIPPYGSCIHIMYSPGLQWVNKIRVLGLAQSIYVFHLLDSHRE